MSAQYRAEVHKLCDKYARAFGVDASLVRTEQKCVNGLWDLCIHVPSRPDLPRWGMGNNSEDWQDGPTQDKPYKWMRRPPKVVIVSRRKR